MTWGLASSIDNGWYDPFEPGSQDRVLVRPLRVPDEHEQAVRRDTFKQASPVVQLARVGDQAQATVPLLYGEQTITRKTWRELLDELNAPDADSAPG